MRSELTFNEIADNLPYVKVVWNGDVIYDDLLDLPYESNKEMYKVLGKRYVDSHWGIKGLNYIREHYGNRVVYSMYMRVVDFHHCELFIEGK